VVSNCVRTGNSVWGFTAAGGGAEGGTLHNCTVTGNSAGGTGSSGGGADSSTLNNCVLTGDSVRGAVRPPLAAGPVSAHSTTAC